MNLTEGPREKAHMYCRFKFSHVICSGLIWPSESISSPLSFHRVINWRDNLLDLYTKSDSLRLMCGFYHCQEQITLKKSKCEMIIFLYEAASQHCDLRTAKKLIQIICADLICY